MNQQPPTSQSEVHDWFNELPNQAPEKPHRPPRNWKPLIAIGALIAVIAIGAVVVTAISGSTTKVVADCLTAGDYEALAGEAPTDSIDVSENFFDFPVTFVPDSTVFDETESPSSDEIIYRMGKLYTDRPKVDLHFTLTAVRVDQDNWYLSQDRLDLVQKKLIEAKIPSDKITADPAVVPDDSSVESDPEAEGADINDSSVVIKVTSKSTCQSS